MPAISIDAVLWVICAVHIIRSGRPYYWIAVITVPLIGPAIYFWMEILPELRHDPGVHRATRKVLDRINPERERQRIEQQLRIADTPKNRLALAQESARMGDWVNASDLYQSCLAGVYANDPAIMLGFAQARFGLGDFANARQVLDDLVKANPQFRSPQGHLLYARVLDALGEHAAANAEFEALLPGSIGEEARTRYALFLKQRGRNGEARELFEQVLARAKLAPRYYRREQQEWLDVASGELRQFQQVQARV